MIIKLMVEGGDMKPGPVVGQKLGPLGINIGQVVQEVNKSTQDFKGMKVPVELNINKNKKFSVKVLSPPTTELLKKELGLEKASGEPHKIKVANASIEQIISIAKTKYPNMLANDFKSAVKTVVGSCVSSGILIENKTSKEIEREIDSGNYDSEILEQKTKTSPDKRKKLDDYFEEVSAQQAEILKKESAAEEEKKAKEEAAAAEGGEKKEEAEKEAQEKEAESAAKKYKKE